MSGQTILVEMTEIKRTWAAMYDACTLARHTGDRVALVEMLPNDYLRWTMDGVEEYQFSETESEAIRAYRSIAEEQGVPFDVVLVSYDNWEEALVRVADELDASAVFARVPDSLIPFFHDAPLRHLRNVMREHHHDLHRMEMPL